MKSLHPPAVSIFSQTLLAMLGYLVIIYLVTTTFIYVQLSGEPSFIGMAEIAERLADNVAPGAMPASLAKTATLSRSLAPPGRPEGMVASTELNLDLARRLHTRPDAVRLFYAPDQRGFTPFASPGRSDMVPRLRGEALFFNGVLAAVRRGSDWHILTLPLSARMIDWKRRRALIPATNGILLIVIAFFFARHLSGPIRRFAASADRLGRHASSPPVPVKGPAELRTAAEAINAMQRRIEDILRERTEMVAAIAHDLRTPLARIAFRVENSAEAIREPVLDDIDQMREMIAATLDFSRAAIVVQTADTCDLSALIEDIVRSAQELGHDVTAVTPSSLQVTGDPLALKRMLQNLVENAVKYADGAVIDARSVGDLIVIEVRDTGPGLPTEMLERVLAPFVRNEPSRSRDTGGVGLGLAISKAIASKHGGSLVLSNRGGKGLTARVTLSARPPAS